jgi:hypothetical protein
MMEKATPAAELEATARVVNAEPWEPLAGMMKRQCSECRYSDNESAEPPPGGVAGREAADHAFRL